MRRLRLHHRTTLTTFSTARRPSRRLTPMLLLRELVCRSDVPTSTQPPRSRRSARTPLLYCTLAACAACLLSARPHCSSLVHHWCMSPALSLCRPPPPARTGATTTCLRPSGLWANHQGSRSTCACLPATSVPLNKYPSSPPTMPYLGARFHNLYHAFELALALPFESLVCLHRACIFKCLHHVLYLPLITLNRRLVPFLALNPLSPITPHPLSSCSSSLSIRLLCGLL